MALPRPQRARPPLPPGAERRRSKRFELLAQVELRRSEDVTLLPVANISAGGMLLGLDGQLADLAVGEQVRVFIELAELQEPIALTIEAKVMRVNGVASVALMWTALSDATRSQLAKLTAWLATRK